MSDEKAIVPDGWVLLPRALTMEMRGGAQQAFVRKSADADQLAAIYQGFIDFAPQPPKASPQADDEPRIVQSILVGGRITHVAPVGASVNFIPGGKGAAAVIGSDFEPYIVYPDGRTARVEFRGDVPDIPYRP